MGNTPIVPQNPTPQTSDSNGGVLGHAVLGALQSTAENANDASLPQGAQYGTPEAQLPADATIGESTSAPPERGVLENLAGGVMKGASETVVGLGNLAADAAEKILRLPSGSLHASIVETEKPSVARDVGELGENVGEFMLGGEAAKGVSKLAAAAPALKGIVAMAHLPEPVLNLIEKYPTAAKIFTTVAKGAEKVLPAAAESAAVGGAQGAVKGAAEDQAESGAVGGAIGGATGSVLADVTVPALNSILRNFGQLGGLDASGTLVRAARPSISEGKAFVRSLDQVLPRLVEANKATPVRTIGAFEDLVHNTANDLWTGEIAPQIARHADDVLDLSPVADEIRTAATRNMKEYFPQEAEAIDNFANLFDKTTTVAKADEDLQAFNAKLQKYYKAAPDVKASILKTDGDVAGLEAATDALRNTLYSHLEAAGEDIPAELRRQYGALKTIERVFGKRAIVSDRQAPINLPQAIGAIGAVASGHALVAAIPMLTRLANSSDFLLRRGLSKATVEAGQGGITSMIKGGIKKAAPAVGSVAGRAATSDNEEPNPTDQSENQPELPNGYAHIRASDGREFYIPQEHMRDAYGIDAGLQLLRMAAYPSPSA